VNGFELIHRSHARELEGIVFVGFAFDVTPLASVFVGGDDEIDFVVLEESVEVISFGRSVQKRVLSGFGVEKAAHGIELTEIQSENFHSTCVLWVWGWNFVTFLRCKRRTRSRVRFARFYSKGSHTKPRTYMDSFCPFK
jgi:hypothetical protein